MHSKISLLAFAGAVLALPQPETPKGYHDKGGSSSVNYNGTQTASSSMHSVTMTGTYGGSSPSGSMTTKPPTTSHSMPPETQYTTFTSLCTENGTTTIHTHSMPIHNMTSSSTMLSSSSSVAVYPTGSYGQGSSSMSMPPYPSGSMSQPSSYGTGSMGSSMPTAKPTSYGTGSMSSSMPTNKPSSYGTGSMGSSMPTSKPSSYGTGNIGSSMPTGKPSSYGTGSMGSSMSMSKPSSYGTGSMGSSMPIGKPSSYGTGSMGSSMSMSKPSSYGTGNMGSSMPTGKPTSYGSGSMSSPATSKPTGTSMNTTTVDYTTYTTVTTCPVTETYSGHTSTHLTTSTIVVTTCKGGCHGSPTPSSMSHYVPTGNMTTTSGTQPGPSKSYPGHGGGKGSETQGPSKSYPGHGGGETTTKTTEVVVTLTSTYPVTTSETHS
ncbi:hypothetical protein KC352_g36618, partial [Hortaea werneckii]